MLVRNWIEPGVVAMLIILMAVGLVHSVHFGVTFIHDRRYVAVVTIDNKHVKELRVGKQRSLSGTGVVLDNINGTVFWSALEGLNKGCGQLAFGQAEQFEEMMFTAIIWSSMHGMTIPLAEPTSETVPSETGQVMVQVFNDEDVARLWAQEEQYRLRCEKIHGP